MSGNPDRASGITGLVLTTGEPTTAEAIESLKRQTLPMDDIIVVRDMAPFHVALNAGARQVATPYFLQVDADMILDPVCAAELHRLMQPDVGIAVGLLRDAMVGRVGGIKLFRTVCFENGGFDDSISPDTDFGQRIERSGWRTVHAERLSLPGGDTLGEHRPDYTPTYTYRKYLMEGERYRYRRAIGGMRGHLHSLEASTHPSILFARVALARGFFREVRIDALGRQLGDDEFARLEAFLSAPAGTDPPPGPTPPAEGGDVRSRFSQWFRFGRSAYLEGNPKAFRDALAALSTTGGRGDNLALQLALCQGLLAGDAEDEAQALAALEGLLLPPAPGVAGAIEADIVAYAARTGLRRFLLVSGGTAEYRSPRPGAPYEKSDARIALHEDARGRQRVRAPFRPFGHAISLEPSRPQSAMWVLDLLRAGITFVHIPTAFGACRLNLPALLAATALERLGWRRPPTDPRRESAVFERLAAQGRHDAGTPRRVLMVAENLERGGSERQMVAAIGGLVARGYDVRLLVLEPLPIGAPSYEAELAGLGIHPEFGSAEMLNRRPTMQARLEGVRPEDAAAIPAWLHWRIACVAEAVARHHPATIHAWLDGPGVAAALAGSALGVPRIVIQQGSLSIARRGHSQSEVMRRAYRAVARSPAVTIVNNSAAGARDNEAWIGLPRGQIGVLLNGFAPEFATPASREAIARLRAAHGIGTGEPVVGTMMRFVAEKDPELWLDTAAAIAAARPAVRFLIFGFGGLEARMRSRIETLGLAARIAMAGPTIDPGTAYGAMDVVLMTSAIEGLPNVLIEAQAVGRPVVATDAGGSAEAVLDGVTGTIVRERSSGRLAAATIALLDDRAFRDAAMIEGPRFVSRRFGFDRMIEETIGFYAPPPAQPAD